MVKFIYKTIKIFTLTVFLNSLSSTSSIYFSNTFLFSSSSSFSSFLLSTFLLSHFLLSVLSSWLSDCNVLSVKIISNKSSNKFNNFLCPGVCFLYFIISAFFILSNVFKSFLACISLIVLFLILFLMSIYLNSPILFL